MSLRIMMQVFQKQWIYGGAVILTAVSAITVLGGVPNAWIPMPLPIVLVAFLSMLLFPLVTPALYVLLLKLLYSSKHFSKIVLILVVVLGALNILYFQNSWEYGVKYQGLAHTKIVAIENFLGFGIVTILAVLALANGSRQLMLVANFLLFLLLSWCAFPYLGELP